MGGELEDGAGEAANWAIGFDQLTIGEQIGQGASSQVFFGSYAASARLLACSTPTPHTHALATFAQPTYLLKYIHTYGFLHWPSKEGQCPSGSRSVELIRRSYGVYRVL